jgi:phage gpG-like protein
MTPGQFARLCRELPQTLDSLGVETLHANVGDVFREAQANNFARASNESNASWPPRKHKYPWPILRKTRRMHNAASRRGAVGNITRTAGKRLVLGIRGSDVPYAKFHQFGTSRLPVRQFFYLRAEDRPLLRPPVRSHLMRVYQATRGKIGGR